MKRLEVLWHGPSPEQAPTLVFLHEGLGSAAQWRDFPERLAAEVGMGALVYSRAGYGRSETISLPRPLRYMQDEGEKDLPELLDAMHVREAVLVGHSDGGSIALVHAGTPRAYPRLKSVITLAPHVFCGDVSVEAIRKAKQEYEHGDLRGRLAKYHDDVDAAFWGWNRAWLDPGFRTWNIESYLPQIRVPILVIQGEDDPYGTIAQVEAIERGAKDVQRLIFPSCGHAPQREKPEETLSAMVTSLRRR